KSLLGMHFVSEGHKLGEASLVVNFEEFPEVYMKRAALVGMDLEAARAKGLHEVLFLRPLDLSVDEAVYGITDAIKRIKAKRVVIDSLSGFELAVAPSFREDFRESIYRMIGSLTRLGVTIVATIEIQETFTSFALSPHAISILSDNVIRLRYVELDGELSRVMVIMKMRNSQHSKKIYQFKVSSEGVVIQGPLKNYLGLISGLARPMSDHEPLPDLPHEHGQAPFETK
ncbi:MAG: protein kinase, partial [Proteobacteria bacterium]